jgi:hypothetical protein
MTRTYEGSKNYTFEYEPANEDDPGYVECRINFEYTVGTPETGRGYMADPANYDPGSRCEIAYDYAEIEVERNGKKVFERLKTGEWLDQHCRARLASWDESDLESAMGEMS